MSPKRSLELFGGSVAVYLFVAACGSQGGFAPKREPVANAGTGGVAAGAEGLGGMVALGGQPGAGSAQDAGAGRGNAGRGVAGEGMAGTIMNPVPDASAQEGGAPVVCDCPEPEPYVPPEPEVVTVPCVDRWAELARDESGYWLDRSQAFMALDDTDPRLGRGFAESPVLLARADGKVGANCIDATVRFVLYPR
jgi:hypothetical protein